MAGCSGVGSEMSEKNDSDGEIVSMVDVLKADNDLEEEANAVLGDSDDKFCTFPQGYLGRQALYACETCCPVGTSDAAICLACSYECHEGHNLFELYTKRNIRCDCGNSKFNNLTCKLFPNKTETNDQNSYNHNFKGLYCTCKRPYPDPDDDVEDEMIQCIICEDWYHGRHLGIGPPVYLDYQEMICTTCMDKQSFLWAYTVNSIETKHIEKQEQEVVEIETKPDTNSSEGATNSCDDDQPPPKKTRLSDDEASSADKQINIKSCIENDEAGSNQKSFLSDRKSTDDNEAPTVKEIKADNIAKQQTMKESIADDKVVAQEVNDVIADDTGLAQEVNGSKADDTEGKIKQESDIACILEELMARNLKPRQHATFWPNGWRAKLCTCQKCKEMYKINHLEFLPEMSDTVLAYEQRGKAKQTAGVTQYDRGIQALSSMHRTQQIEVISEYNDLQSELKEYLRTFSEEGKVVQEEDIRRFFDEMKSKKRQRSSEGTVQTFCR